MSIRTRFKIFYTILYLGVGVYFPYLALYLIQKGMSGAEMGILLSVMPLISIIFQPVWCVLSDIYPVRRLVLCLACFGQALGSLVLGLAGNFTGLMIAIVLSSIVSAPIGALATTLALDYLEGEQKRDEFGLLRLWGSIGFSISTLLFGGLFIETMLVNMPFIHCGLYILVGLVVLALPDSLSNQTRGWWGGGKKLSLHPSLWLFAAAALVLGATLGIGHQYLTVFLEDLHASGWLIGIAMALQAVAEVPLMANVPWFIRRWGLAAGVMVGVYLLPLRWLVLALAQAPIWALPGQVLHATATVSLYMFGVMFVDQRIPGEWRATAQGLLAVAMNGLGPSLGLFIAGNIFQQSGSRFLWIFSTVFAIIGGIMMFIAIKKIIRNDPAEALKSYA